MSKVEFDEFQTQSYTDFDDTPKIFNWVINYSGGLVKDKYQAQYVLFGFVIFLIVISGFLIFSEKGNFPVTEVIIQPWETVGSPQGL